MSQKYEKFFGFRSHLLGSVSALLVMLLMSGCPSEPSQGIVNTASGDDVGVDDDADATDPGCDEGFIECAGTCVDIDDRPFGDTEGSEEDPHPICRGAQLEIIAASPDYLDAYFVLMEDIELDNELAPIGSRDEPFVGHFDGQDHAMEGLVNGIGLFGWLGEDAYVFDLVLVDVDISGTADLGTGGLAGGNQGQVANIEVSGEVSGGDNVGGLVGRNIAPGELDGIASDVRVTGGQNVGGIAGESQHRISSAHATGNISGEGSNVGGVVGLNTGGFCRIEDSSAADNLVRGEEVVGGLVGLHAGENCEIRDSSTDNIIGDDDSSNVGGLVGVIGDGAMVVDSHSDSVVRGRWAVGGLVGRIGHCSAFWDGTCPDDLGGGQILDSTSDATVEGSSHVGGLLGVIRGAESRVTRSSATREVSGTGVVGGLIGMVRGDGVVVEQCFADVSVESTGPSWGTESAGGLVGEIRDESQLLDSYATGPVEGGGTVGGLVGEIGNCLSGCSGTVIARTYAVGRVDANESGSYVGGLVGYDNNDNSVTDSFWHQAETEQDTSDGGTGLGEDDFVTQSVFVDAEWEFPEVWYMPDGDYPRLSWEQ